MNPEIKHKNAKKATFDKKIFAAKVIFTSQSNNVKMLDSPPPMLSCLL
jgi:hypothetical protein